MMTATAAVYWGWALVGGRPVLPAQIPSAAWVGLVGVGVVSTFIAIQTFYAGTQRIGAAQAALISTVEPFYTITLAALLFGDRADAGPAASAAALIIVGVVIAQTGPGAGGAADARGPRRRRVTVSRDRRRRASPSPRSPRTSRRSRGR